MIGARVAGVRVAGLAAAVPSQASTAEETLVGLPEGEVAKIVTNSGVSSRRVAGDGVCTSDLCHAAADRLLDKLGWDRASVGLLVFVSQTPDYVLPATSCTLQERLGLSKDVAAFDVNLGCSGYVYGLFVASQLLTALGTGRALLLVGDTISKIAGTRDRTVSALFGDAGSATALERDVDAPAIDFVLGTDGRGASNLIVPAGGFRYRSCAASRESREREDANLRSDEQLFMDGKEIFAFTLREVPKLLRSITEQAGVPIEAFDAFVLHQANKFMLEHLAKKCRLPADRVPIALGARGNTSSASIPLAVVDSLRDQITSRSMKLMLGGFGVGYSWAGASLTIGPLTAPPVVEVTSPLAGADDA